jgi:CheY-like chemotaxis protein
VRGGTILIVDDEMILSSLISESLEMEGPFNVESASNGLEGLEKYKVLLPDLVIMDIHMPVMDGYESARRIKSFDPKAKILILTGNPSDIRARKTLEEGVAVTLLEKPLKLADLSRIVRKNLEI